jgi:hypothetical protein
MCSGYFETLNNPIEKARRRRSEDPVDPEGDEENACIRERAGEIASGACG